MLAHGVAQGLEAAMESGRCGPEGDIEDLRDLTHGQVEVVVERDDGPLVDVEPAELGHHPFAIGDVCRCVRDANAVHRRDHPDLDLASADGPSSRCR